MSDHYNEVIKYRNSLLTGGELMDADQFNRLESSLLHEMKITALTFIGEVLKTEGDADHLARCNILTRLWLQRH